MRINSFMSWVGGKKSLRDEILARFPVYYERYIEVFGGGGWVLFYKPPMNDFEVYNDFISVLSNVSVAARIYALMNILKGLAEIEILCLNSRADFDDNKAFLRSRCDAEKSSVVRKLLEKDQTYLDRIQVQMATAREFVIMIRLHGEKESELFPYLNRIEKSIKEQGFSVKRADAEDIKRLLAVYFEQNVTTEKYEDYDGERWVIMND